MVDDELELGLPEAKPRRAAVAEGVSWRRHQGERRLCMTCVAITPKKDGVPVHTIPHAYYVRRENGVNNYLCVLHAEERRRLDAATA